MSDFFSSKSSDDNFVDSVSYEVVNTNERIIEIASLLEKETVLAVDTENSTINPHEGWPLLLQIGTSEKCYVFEGWRNVEKFNPGEKLDFSPLKKVLEDPKVLKVLFQAKYDWKWIFVHYGIKIANLCCLQVAERLLTVGLPNARRRPALRELVLKYLGMEMSKEARSKFVNRDPVSEPITEEEFAYSAGDVVLLPDIYYLQRMDIEELGLERAQAMENRVLPPLAKAEVTGVWIDTDKWHELLKEAAKKYRETSKKIYKSFDGVLPQKTLFGIPPFNIASRDQLMKNLKRLGYKLEDTEEATLKKYKNKHEVFEHLLDWRGYNKILTSYGEKLLQRICSNTDRLHAQFNQVLADTGRMSAEKPNLQNIPGHDEDDPDSLDFRSCFMAKPGYKLITADFSQQELRILADLSGDKTFRKAYTELDDDGNDLDVHRYTASVIFDVPYNEVTKEQRTRAKTLNFFLVYGGGAFALAETLKCSEDEAQKIIDDYFARYGDIKKFLNGCANEALRKGYSETISGRKRFLPLPVIDDPMFRKIKASVRRKAQNNPIQGGGADVTKMALVFLYERLEREGYDATVIMVVHDEFVVEVREDQAEVVAKIVEEEMVRGFTHFFKNIPMKVDAHIGPTWEK